MRGLLIFLSFFSISSFLMPIGAAAAYSSTAPSTPTTLSANKKLPQSKQKKLSKHLPKKKRFSPVLAATIIYVAVSAGLIIAGLLLMNPTLWILGLVLLGVPLLVGLIWFVILMINLSITESLKQCVRGEVPAES